MVVKTTKKKEIKVNFSIPVYEDGRARREQISGIIRESRAGGSRGGYSYHQSINQSINQSVCYQWQRALVVDTPTTN